jgi:hypothetical protein
MAIAFGVGSACFLACAVGTYRADDRARRLPRLGIARTG